MKPNLYHMTNSISGKLYSQLNENYIPITKLFVDFNYYIFCFYAQLITIMQKYHFSIVM